jgi:hypothetical protein
MKVLLLASHAIAEYDDIRMFVSLGYDVFCPGGYEDPTQAKEGMRPTIEGQPDHADLRAACVAQREKHAGESTAYAIDWAKADLHPDLIDWADVIICHHFPVPWLHEQWPRLQGKRVIWRTCGQSNADLESRTLPFRRDGLEIVRYSPKEAALGNYVGHDAIIRFGKFPEDYPAWTGDESVVINVTQHLYQRHPATNWEFWEVATMDLPRLAIGPGSEVLGGPGALTTTAMYDFLAYARAYLYTGTQPASYTLGLIEAMMVGIPTVSIGPNWMALPELFEGHELTLLGYDHPEAVTSALRQLLNDSDYAAEVSAIQRDTARSLFGMDVVGPQWEAYLG